MASAKVRANSRVGTVMKAWLDAGEVMHVRKAIRPRWLEVDAVPCCVDDVVHWAGRRCLELRPHDIVELRACIFGISRGDSWSEPFWLPELHLARGRWSQATGWAHDFDADGREWVTLPSFGLPLFSPDA